MARIANQILEKLEFFWQQLDLLSTPADYSRHEIHVKISDAQQRFLDDGSAASRKSFDPRQQFRECEWLDEVVIATGAQTTYPIVDLTERTDDQDRRDDPALSQALHHGDSVDIGQHAINRHHGIIGGMSVAQRLVAIGCQIHLIAVRRERLHPLPSCFRVVLNDENAASDSGHDLGSPYRRTKAARESTFVVLRSSKLTYLSETDAFVIGSCRISRGAAKRHEGQRFGGGQRALFGFSQSDRKRCQPELTAPDHAKRGRCQAGAHGRRTFHWG